MFVHPSQVNQVMQRHPEIIKARLVVTGQMANDTMTLHCELDDPAGGDAAAIVNSIRDLTKLRGEVQFVARGSLPSDGKVIDDARDYK
jgi:phenylacetate-CoA ligase